MRKNTPCAFKYLWGGGGGRSLAQAIFEHLFVKRGVSGDISAQVFVAVVLMVAMYYTMMNGQG